MKHVYLCLLTLSIISFAPLSATTVSLLNDSEEPMKGIIYWNKDFNPTPRGNKVLTIPVQWFTLAPHTTEHLEQKDYWVNRIQFFYPDDKIDFINEELEGTIGTYDCSSNFVPEAIDIIYKGDGKLEITEITKEGVMEADEPSPKHLGMMKIENDEDNN